MPLDPVKNIFGIPSTIGSPEKCLLLIQNFSFALETRAVKS